MIFFKLFRNEVHEWLHNWLFYSESLYLVNEYLGSIELFLDESKWDELSSCKTYLKYVLKFREIVVN